MVNTVIYQGSCHCGAVAFTVEAPAILELDECNCSICAKSGYLHLIVTADRFALVSGEEFLETYTFNSRLAKHTFCKVCGVKPFYTPRSHPDGISVNARCLDTLPEATRITPFDGRNWEKNVHSITGERAE